MKILPLKAIFIVIISFYLQSIQAQSNPLNGNYIIGYDTVDYYSDFEEAVDALIENGVSGPVIFSVKNGSYNEKIVIPEIQGASSVNTITFISESMDSSKVSVQSSTANDSIKGIICLDGADYIRFIGIGFSSWGDASGRVFDIRNGATNNIISKSLLKGLQDSISVVYISGQGNTNNQIAGNYIQYGTTGIESEFNSVSVIRNLIVEGNTFKDQTQYGIHLNYNESPLISGNTLSPHSSVTEGYIGIQFEFTTGLWWIEKNKINFTAGNNGIRILDSNGSVSEQGIISNNFISIGGSNFNTGISIEFSSFLKIYYNSINIISTASNSTGIYLSSASQIRIQNNNLCNTGGGICISTDVTEGIVISDRNNLYTTGTFPASIGEAPVNLEQWQDYDFDNLSVSVDPYFVSFTDLHARQLQLVEGGAHLDEILSDIDGELRDENYPNIGADEYPVPVADAGIISMVQPAVPFIEGTYDIYVAMQNHGFVPITNCDIRCQINGMTTQEEWYGQLEPGEIDTVYMGEYIFTENTAYSIAIYTVNPNEDFDGIPSNDTFKIDPLYTAFNGIYYLGGADADFDSFGEATIALQNSGVLGQVSILVRDGTYNERVTIGNIPGASEENTIVIRSESEDSSLVILTDNSMDLLKMDGATHVNIHQITLESTYSSQARVATIKNGNYISFTNCLIKCNPEATGLSLLEFGNHYDNTTIRNNRFEGGRIGVTMREYPEGNYSSNILIEGNVFFDQSNGGLYLQYISGELAIRSNLFREATSNAISLYNSSGSFIIEKNKVEYLLSTGSGTGIGITNYTGSADQRGLIINNFISAGQGSTSKAISITNSNFIDIFNNNFHCDEGAGIDSRVGNFSGCTDINLLNNIFANSGNGYSLYVELGENFGNSDYNDLYAGGEALAFWDEACLKLSNLQTISGMEINSISANPLFVSSTDLHVRDVGLDGSADPIEQVQDDIDGQLRDHENPDIGADEFTPGSTTDASLTEILSPAEHLSQGVQNIAVVLRNAGSVNLQSTNIRWTVNSIEQNHYQWNGSLLPGATDTVIIGTYTFADITLYTMRVWTENPNGNPDLNPENDSLHLGPVYPMMSDAYTVGGASPDFATLQTAFDILSLAGAGSSVVLNIRPGTYDEKLILPGIHGLNGTSTLTIRSENGDSSSVIVTNSNTSEYENFVLRFDNVSFIVLEHVSLVSANNDYQSIIELFGSVHDITIQHNNIRIPVTSGSYSSLIYNSTEAGSSFDDIIIRNNFIGTGGRGIYFTSANLTEFDGLTIEGNHFENQGTSIQISRLKNISIMNNQMVHTGNNTGISLELCSEDLSIAGNAFKLIGAGVGIRIYGCNYSEDSPATIVNNFIYVGGNTSNSYGIYLQESSYIDLYFNTIHFANTQQYYSRACYVDFGSFIRLVNNNFARSQGGIVLYVSDPQSVSYSDFNNLYTTEWVVAHWGVHCDDLDSLQSVSGMDLHSVSVPPMFVSDQDLHTQQFLLKGAGIPIAGIVTDIDGDLRNTQHPDLGADEFTLSQIDVGIDSIITPQSGCTASFVPVTFRIRNYGNLPQTGFQAGYILNDSILVIQNIGIQTVNPGYTIDFSFAGLLDVSKLGSYHIKAFVNLAGDENNSNDSLFVENVYRQIPAVPMNMLPVDGDTNIVNPVDLSWSPSQHATLYDLYLWLTDYSKPEVPAVSGTDQIMINDLAVSYGKDYYWQVDARNEYCSAISDTQKFKVCYLPDLTVSNVNPPPVAFAGQNIIVDWEIKNSGEGTTGPGQWYDGLFLSLDTAYNYGTDKNLGYFANQTALSPGQSYIQTQEVTIPADINDTFYIVAYADYYNSIPEAGNNNNNNAGHSNKFFIEAGETPDLVVDSVLFTETVFSGETRNLTWTVRNEGEGKTIGDNWHDMVYFSQEVFPSTTGIKIAEVKHEGNLNPGESYKITIPVRIPDNIEGEYYIHVNTDATGKIYEQADEENNIDISDSIQVILTPTPNLSLEAIQTSEFASNSETISISWIVENKGSDYFLSPFWADSLFLSSVAELDYNKILCKKRIIHQGKMNHGEQYTGNTTITIPKDITDSCFLIVKTDATESIFENGLEEDNLISGIKISVLTPDLQPTNISIPDTGWSGENITVEWAVLNAGNGDVYGSEWTDSFYISAHATYAAGDLIEITDESYYVLLESGDSIVKQKNIKLPDGIEGHLYLYVFTDVLNSIFEVNNTNNVNTTGIPIFVSLSPWPDLSVKDVQYPDTVTAGFPSQLTYKVKNEGTAQTQYIIWSDNVFLSANASWDEETAIEIRSFYMKKELYADSMYLNMGSFIVPDSLPEGNYYLYLISDAYDTIYEHGSETNNIGRSQQFYLKAYPPVDLGVDYLNCPDESYSGNLILVQYTIQNYGDVPLKANSWTDAVVLSKDTIWSADDIVIEEIERGSLIYPGNSQTYSRQVLVPDGTEGDYYLLLVCDANYEHNDKNRSNNTGMKLGEGHAVPIHVILTPPADLQLCTFYGPATGISGQTIRVKWTVCNEGSGTTVHSSWSERFYLSTDLIPDTSDIVLGTQVHTGKLAVGNSYSDSLDISVPVKLAGNYILIAKTDNNNVEYEHLNEDNNIAISLIVLVQPPPSDLTVTEVEVPAEAISGQEITLSWEISNIGVNLARGIMNDMVYISADTLWDINDQIIGSVSEQIELLPDNHFTRSLTAGIPGISKGEYHLIVRTDIMDNIYESDNLNNTGFSYGTVHVQVKELPLNTIVPDELYNGQPLYYRIEIPETMEGEALYVSLNGDSLYGDNELYLSYEQSPDRNNYDYSYHDPFKAKQEIVVPELIEGTYYLLAYGISANGLSQQVELFAKQLNFEIFSVESNTGGNSGKATLYIRGAKFDKDIVFSLKNNSGTINSDTLVYVNSTEVYVRFDLQGAATGNYDIAGRNPNGEKAELLQGYTIVEGSEPDLQISLIYPEVTRHYRTIAIQINYHNAGTTDLDSVMIVLESHSGAPLSYTIEGLKDKKLELPVLLTEKGYPGTILRPGARGSATIFSFTQGRYNMIYSFPDPVWKGKKK